MNRICSKCGKDLDENALFCAYCGTRILPAAEDAPLVHRRSFAHPAPPHGPMCHGFLPEKSRMGFCLAGFVFGLLSLFCSFFPFFSLFCAILGIVFSAYGMKKVPGAPGRGFAIAGLILGIAGCLFTCLIFLIALFELFTYTCYEPFYDYSDFSALGAIFQL